MKPSIGGNREIHYIVERESDLLSGVRAALAASAIGEVRVEKAYLE